MATPHFVPKVAPIATVVPEVAQLASPAAINVPAGFSIVAADAKLLGTPVAGGATGAPPPAPLGVLSNFTGEFAGTGFNTIFRPNSGPPTSSDNVLELNLTTETLTFSAPLGNVPNRGLKSQPDISLNGVPYVQAISDVTNTATGKADGTPTGIHFEPGLWMHIPATGSDPVVPESLVRMGSIPHGTTINAEALEPTTTIAGPPTIPAVDITPFNAGGKIPFASQTATNTGTPRLPQDLTKFIAAGTITQAILTDPNTVLRNAIKGQKITKTVVFTVSTAPSAPELGGGTANIGFLLGTPRTAAPTPRPSI